MPPTTPKSVRPNRKAVAVGLVTALALGGAGYWYLTKEDDGDRDARTAALGQIVWYAQEVRGSFESQQYQDRSWPPDGDGGGGNVGPGTNPGNSQPPTAANRAAVLEDFERRFRQIEQSQPTTSEEIEGRTAALAELSQACAEYVCRGSVESYRLQAAVEVDMAILREVAVQLGFPATSVPTNHYELLPAAKLEKMEGLQVRKVAVVKERNTLFAGLYSVAVVHEEQVLEQIQAAKGKPTFDPTAFFTAAVRGKKLPPAALAALKSDSARATAIATLEAQLIATAAARDHSNVGLHVRFWQLQPLLSTEARAPFQEYETRIAVIHQIKSTLPADPKRLRETLHQLAKGPDTVAEAVLQYNRARHSDPIRAAELLVVLKNAYSAGTWQSTSGGAEAGFHRWMAGHLTRGQLYELVTQRVRPTADVIADMIAVRHPSAGHPADREAVQSLFDQFTKELGERSKDAKPGDSRLRSAFTWHPPASQEVYAELRVVSEFVPQSAEVKTALRSRGVDGLVAQLDALDAVRDDVERARELNSESVKSLKEIGGDGNPAREIGDAHLSLARAYRSVELALDGVLVEEPGLQRAKAARQRAKAGLAALPPPVTELGGVRAAEMWVDPLVAKEISRIKGTYVVAIKASTFAANKARERHIQERKEAAEAEKYWEGMHAQWRTDAEVSRGEPKPTSPNRTIDLGSRFGRRYGSVTDRDLEAEMLKKLLESGRIVTDIRPDYGSLPDRYGGSATIPPNAKYVGKLQGSGLKVYDLGPLAGPKNFVDENGNRYRKLLDGRL